MADWESLKKLDTEKTPAYQAFLDYVAQGPGRSLHKLYEEYVSRTDDDPAPPTRNERTIDEWSLKHEWQKRIAAYLGEQRKALGNRQKEQYVKLADKGMAQIEKLIEMTDDMLKEFALMRITKRRRVKDPNNPGKEIETVQLKVNTADLNNLIKAHADLQKNLRLALGEKTTVEMDASADGKVKLYIGVSPDDWDDEPEEKANAGNE